MIALPDMEPAECISHEFTDMSKLGNAANHPSSRPKNPMRRKRKKRRKSPAGPLLWNCLPIKIRAKILSDSFSSTLYED